MTREEILSLCHRAPAVGSVRHEEFADYIIALEQRRRIDDEWTTVETAYMSVDGKLAMANEDHRRQSKRLDFAPPQILVDTSEQLTLLVTVTSEVYGTRHGIATSRRAGGSTAESEFPWEVAETSAIGRALTAMGYGLLPGAGLASAEDMLRATGASASKRIPREAIPQRSNAPAPVTTSRRQPPLSAVQRQKLTQLYQQLHHGSEAEIARGLDALFTEAFSHTMSEATYEEGSRLTAQLMAQSKETSPA